MNTTKKTKTDLNEWKRWCESIKETKAIEEIPVEELNFMSFLCQSQETQQTLSSTTALLLSVRNLHRYLLQNEGAWLLIQTKMTELEVHLDC